MCKLKRHAHLQLAVQRVLEGALAGRAGLVWMDRLLQGVDLDMPFLKKIFFSISFLHNSVGIDLLQWLMQFSVCFRVEFQLLLGSAVVHNNCELLMDGISFSRFSDLQQNENIRYMKFHEYFVMRKYSQF